MAIYVIYFYLFLNTICLHFSCVWTTIVPFVRPSATKVSYLVGARMNNTTLPLNLLTTFTCLVRHVYRNTYFVTKNVNHGIQCSLNLYSFTLLIFPYHQNDFGGYNADNPKNSNQHYAHFKKRHLTLHKHVSPYVYTHNHCLRDHL